MLFWEELHLGAEEQVEKKWRENISKVTSIQFIKWIVPP